VRGLSFRDLAFVGFARRLAVAGYFSRGNNTATIYKWAFPTNTVSTTTAAPSAREAHAGFSNPGVAGYFSKGRTYFSVDKWAFPTDTVSGVGGFFEDAGDNAGFANPAVAGYMSIGGTTDLGQNPYAATSKVFKWAFPSDSRGYTTNAPDVMILHAGFANPAVAGYFSQGDVPQPTSATSPKVFKWTFPTDTVTTTTSAPQQFSDHGGFSNPAVAGYMNRPSTTNVVYKWAFPTDTVSTTTAAPAQIRQNAGFANPTVAGYFNRGVNTTTVYSWAFPSDTVSTVTAAPAATRENAGFANAE
jgi:hypothetical protein